MIVFRNADEIYKKYKKQDQNKQNLEQVRHSFDLEINTYIKSMSDFYFSNTCIYF